MPSAFNIFLQGLVTLTSGGKKLAILMYHQVMEQPDFMRPWEIDRAVFDWQLDILAKHFNVLPPHDALTLLRQGRLPPRAVCLTFDDGYANNFTVALPILLKHRLSAAFFIASGYLDGGLMWNDGIIESIRRLPEGELDLRAIDLGIYDIGSPEKKAEVAIGLLRAIKHLDPAERADKAAGIAALSSGLPADLMMTSAQLVKLHQSGMEIGGHTVSHPILANVDSGTTRREIGDNKEFLEQLLKSGLRYFAYPNGVPGRDYRIEQVDMIREFGYLAAVSTHCGAADRRTDRFQLPRVSPWDNTAAGFLARMAKLYATDRL